MFLIKIVTRPFENCNKGFFNVHYTKHSKQTDTLQTTDISLNRQAQRKIYDQRNSRNIKKSNTYFTVTYLLSVDIWCCQTQTFDSQNAVLNKPRLTTWCYKADGIQFRAGADRQNEDNSIKKDEFPPHGTKGHYRDGKWILIINLLHTENRGQ